MTSRSPSASTSACPRSYRGRDIYWWLDRIGQLDERYDEVDDIERARRHASVQLVGSDERRDLDLNALRDGGVQVVGRLHGDQRHAPRSARDRSANLVTNADLKQARLLRRIDEFVVRARPGGRGRAGVRRPADQRHERRPPSSTCTGFSTVIWATGYRPTYPWLTRTRSTAAVGWSHDGGVGALPGLYLLGLPFLRRRRSNLIAGLGADAADLVRPSAGPTSTGSHAPALTGVALVTGSH